MRRIRLPNLFYSVGASKLKDFSKNVLEQFLLSGGITNNKSSLAERVFAELLFFFTNSDQGRQTGGGGWGVSTPPEFWMGGLNTCQPPLILRKKFLGGVWLPLN